MDSALVAMETSAGPHSAVVNGNHGDLSSDEISMDRTMDHSAGVDKKAKQIPEGVILKDKNKAHLVGSDSLNGVKAGGEDIENWTPPHSPRPVVSGKTVDGFRKEPRAKMTLSPNKAAVEAVAASGASFKHTTARKTLNSSASSSHDISVPSSKRSMIDYTMARSDREVGKPCAKSSRSSDESDTKEKCDSASVSSLSSHSASPVPSSLKARKSVTLGKTARKSLDRNLSDRLATAVCKPVPIANMTLQLSEIEKKLGIKTLSNIDAKTLDNLLLERARMPRRDIGNRSRTASPDVARVGSPAPEEPPTTKSCMVSELKKNNVLSIKRQPSSEKVVPTPESVLPSRGNVAVIDNAALEVGSVATKEAQPADTQIEAGSVEEDVDRDMELAGVVTGDVQATPTKQKPVQKKKRKRRSGNYDLPMGRKKKKSPSKKVVQYTQSSNKKAVDGMVEHEAVVAEPLPQVPTDSCEVMDEIEVSRLKKLAMPHASVVPTTTCTKLPTVAPTVLAITPSSPVLQKGVLQRTIKGTSSAESSPSKGGRSKPVLGLKKKLDMSDSGKQRSDNPPPSSPLLTAKTKTSKEVKCGSAGDADQSRSEVVNLSSRGICPRTKNPYVRGPYKTAKGSSSRSLEASYNTVSEVSDLDQSLSESCSPLKTASPVLEKLSHKLAEGETIAEPKKQDYVDTPTVQLLSPKQAVAKVKSKAAKRPKVSKKVSGKIGLTVVMPSFHKKKNLVLSVKASPKSSTPAHVKPASKSSTPAHVKPAPNSSTPAHVKHAPKSSTPARVKPAKQQLSVMDMFMKLNRKRNSTTDEELPSTDVPKSRKSHSGTTLEPDTVPEPATETPLEPATETPLEPATETPLEPAMETPLEPVMERLLEPATETPLESVTETPLESVTETPLEPVTETPLGPELDTVLEPELVTSQEPETELVTTSVPDSELVSAPDPELATTPDPELATTPEPEVESIVQSDEEVQTEPEMDHSDIEMRKDDDMMPLEVTDTTINAATQLEPKEASPCDSVMSLEHTDPDFMPLADPALMDLPSLRKSSQPPITLAELKATLDAEAEQHKPQRVKRKRKRKSDATNGSLDESDSVLSWRAKHVKLSAQEDALEMESLGVSPLRSSGSQRLPQPTTTTATGDITTIKRPTVAAVATTSSRPGTKFVNTPNGVQYPVTPPKTPEGSVGSAGVQDKVTPQLVSPLAQECNFLPLCCCRINGALFSSDDRTLYCQALDSIDGRVVGCCNKVTTPQLLRPAVKIPFMTICEVHRKRHKLHHCCPGCGHFCTQGTFMQCKKDCTTAVHQFHRQCQVYKDSKYYCPHCGEESAQYEVALTLHEPRSMSLFTKPKKNLINALQARMGSISRPARVMEMSEVTVDDEISFKLPTGKELKSSGPKWGPSRTELANAISYLKGEKPKKLRTGPKSLYHAVKAYDMERVMFQLAEGCDPNSKNDDHKDQTPIHAAAYCGNPAIMHLLVQAGGDIHATDNELETPLMVAADRGHLDTVAYLMRSGAVATACREDGMTPLHLAAQSGHTKLCEYILGNANVDINTTLVVAISLSPVLNRAGGYLGSGIVVINMSFITDFPAILDVYRAQWGVYTHQHTVEDEDEGGWSPLIWAAEYKHLETVKFLLAGGSNPNTRDIEQNTALHWAIYAGSVDIAEMFLSAGCDIEFPNEHGDRALHIAARQCHYECVVLLLARGADSLARNNNNETPMNACDEKDSAVWLALKVNRELKGFATKCHHQPLKLLHRDISMGHEANPIPVVNDVDDENYPQDFHYVHANIQTAPLAINRVFTSLQHCTCTDDCSSIFCACGRNSVRCWYGKDGRLVQDFNQVEPPLIFECNKACKCWATCHNRVVQLGITARLQVFRTSGRGWGLRTTLDIKQGTFVCEYVGEHISDAEADSREDDSYLFDLDNKDSDTFCIDARRYANVARFINHLCQPNVIPVKVFIEHQDLRFPRICLFASRDISAGSELGFDYGEKFWIIKWKKFTCTCKSPKCRFSSETIHKTIADYNRRQEEEDEATDDI